ncbi:DUF2189 domain-containing protein [Allochromatium palmeri]|uniref:DUF2189 domain-containing protein n=2 Tax=Allochromatium palmeri TaxID=231048 RepID=A0A6N8EEY3_9GAMM|nr:DUF2189 domain-containing protein [Allochromatium palmeri]
MRRPGAWRSGSTLGMRRNAVGLCMGITSRRTGGCGDAASRHASRRPDRAQAAPMSHRDVDLDLERTQQRVPCQHKGFVRRPRRKHLSGAGKTAEIRLCTPSGGGLGVMAQLLGHLTRPNQGLGRAFAWSTPETGPGRPLARSCESDTPEASPDARRIRMSTYRLSTQQQPQRSFEIRSLDEVRPMAWLRQGLEDFKAEPLWSTVYGAAVAGLGGLFAYLASGADAFFLVPFLFSGFLVVTPMLSLGLMAKAKLRETGRAHDAGALRRLLAMNRSSTAMMGIFLVLVFVNWIMVSNLVYGGVFHQVTTGIERVQPLPVMFTESLPFLLIYGGIAIALAAFVFRIVAFSIPMMLDQKVDAFNAAFASWKAVGENRKPMSLWASIIAALCTLGFLTFFVGLVFVIPWLGYASWHAYRDTMEANQDS